MADDSHTSGGRTYHLVPYDGGDHFKEKKGDLNSNTGHDSANIHLYYTTDSFSDCRAVTGITFNATSSGAVVWNGNVTPADLNDGAGGDYIYMHLATATVTYTITYDLAGGSMPDGTSNPATYTAATSTFTLSEPTRTGYTFTGWTWDGQTTPTKPVTITQGSTGNKSYTANWSNTSPIGRLDTCQGGAAEIAVAGWAYDPDVSAQSIGVQIKVYQNDGTTLVTEETFTADRPRSDVNNAYNITGQHGYSATIANLAAGTYKVKVYALDSNSGTNPQIGSTQTVTVTPGPIAVTIGNSTKTSTTYPFATDRDYSLSQQIYTAEEIGMAGTITSISFRYDRALSMNGVQVYLTHTDKSEFGDINDYVTLATGDKVFEGTFSAQEAGWATITLDTPFEYDGDRNLLVCCYDPTEEYSEGPSCYRHDTGKRMNIYYLSYRQTPYKPDLNCLASFFGQKISGISRNDIRLDIIPGIFPKPQNLGVGICSTEAATLTWTAPETTNTITGYSYQYKKASDGEWSAEEQTPATSASINGLSASTDYDFRVKALYDAGNSSYAVFHFTSAMPLPYECGFENGMDKCGMVDVNWGDTQISSVAKHDGEKCFEFNHFWNDADKKPQYLISPRFAGNVPLTVLFYYMAYLVSGETFQVGYSTTTNEIDAFTWGELITASGKLDYGEGVATAITSWSLYENTFPAGTRYIAVKYISNLVCSSVIRFPKRLYLLNFRSRNIFYLNENAGKFV